jgi:fatty acid desaturase
MRIEWPTVAMMALCYGVWLIAGFYIWPAAPAAALLIFAVTAALHSSLQHEALHGHPTKLGWLNEVLVGVLPLAPAYPYRRFKALHLRHHYDERLTDPYDDPESYYLDGRAFLEIAAPMRALLIVNNTLIGRIVIGPALMVWGFVASELKLARHGDRKVIIAWALHLAGLFLLGTFMQTAFGVPFWLYVLTSGYLGMSIISVRTYCEHQAANDINHRTVIVENSILSLLFLNNNLHLVHHKAPALAWYKLPGLMREKRAEWFTLNGGYVFGGYWEIFKQFAWRGKEPVVHPLFQSKAVPSSEILETIRSAIPH